MSKRLSGKTTIVTGGSRGIGQGIANVFAAEGSNVLIVGRNEASAAQAVEEIVNNGGNASYFNADVSKWSANNEMVKAAVDRYGAIDIVCCNAGIFPEARIEDMTEEKWDETLDVNLKSMMFTVRASLPYLKKQPSGRFVLTSSITGPLTGVPGWAHYGASKAGMLGFMRSAALEFAKHHITINAVLPGNVVVETEVDFESEEHDEILKKSIPMGHLGEPEDIAYAALYFASDEARFATGQTLIVDGGQVLPEYQDMVS